MEVSSNDNHQVLQQIADRNGVSVSAVEHVFKAMASSKGTLAQFNRPELGGMGQWSRGGMLMMGDMFNNELKAKVAAICAEVAELATSHDDRRGSPGVQSQVKGEGGYKPASKPEGNWWPDGLGHASSTGSQNDLHYAFFPESRRLAVRDGSKVTLYDTKDHRIGGVSQQQSTAQSLRFTSQHGPLEIADLEKVADSD